MAISASTYGSIIRNAWNASGAGAFVREFANWDNWSNSFHKALSDFGTGINDLTGVTASNQAAAEQAAAQRSWEEQMDNTKYQRAVADMQAAGLNPATLSGLSSGSVGSAPSGAAASTHAAGASPLNALIGLLGAVIFRNSSTKGQTLNSSREVWPHQKHWRNG